MYVIETPRVDFLLQTDHDAHNRRMHTQPLSILAGVTTDLLASPTLASSLKTVTDAAIDLLSADHASVRLCDEGVELRPAARSGLGSERPPLRFRKGEGILGWVAETGEVARVGDIERDQRFADMAERGFPVRSILSVPLSSTGKVMGVLSVSAAREHAFGEDHEQVGKVLANCAAQAIRISELEVLTVTDAHTRAFNQRYLVPRLQEEMSRSARAATPLSLLLLDLDHFKRVNDRFGHAVGDAVLRAFVDRVRSCVRDIDILVRRGGEEFVLIMPATDSASAVRVANRIRLRLSGAPIRVRDRTLVFQTVSVGVASWDGQEGAERFDERADVAMYEAKRKGRNRVVVAGPVPTDLRTRMGVRGSQSKSRASRAL